jgi:hypothetical protein
MAAILTAVLTAVSAGQITPGEATERARKAGARIPIKRSFSALYFTHNIHQ